jgi:mannose-6-phosphate isomerase
MAKAQLIPANQFGHVYLGGSRIGTFRNGPGGPQRPEDWIGSTTTRFGEKTLGLSQLANGEFLRDLIYQSPLEWLGKDHFDNFGSSIEILVKLLDPAQRLPVHYHPNKKFAHEKLNLNHGKTEAWVILEAPKGSKVRLGFKKDMEKQQIKDWVFSEDYQSLLNSLESFEVKKGDTVFVPAGYPHCIDSGIFILELQEPTDLSALLEWKEFNVDGFSEGHLGLGYDVVLDALNLSPISELIKNKLFKKEMFPHSKNVSLFDQIADPYFRAHFIANDQENVEEGFSILLITDGTGEIHFENQSHLEVKEGNAVVIPFNSGNWKLVNTKGIVTRPPKIEAARKGI